MDNHQRAAWGKRAVSKGNPDHSDSMAMENGGLETSASDTIANILHYVHGQGGDVEMALRMTTGNFNVEKEGTDNGHIKRDPTRSENQRLASILKKWFPWLGTEEQLKSCADQIDTLNELYRALVDDDTPVDPTLDQLINRYGDMSFAYGEAEEGSDESAGYYAQVEDAREALVNFVNSRTRK